MNYLRVPAIEGGVDQGNELHIAAARVTGEEARKEQLASPADEREQIVEVVGYAAIRAVPVDVHVRMRYYLPSHDDDSHPRFPRSARFGLDRRRGATAGDRAPRGRPSRRCGGGGRGLYGSLGGAPPGRARRRRGGAGRGGARLGRLGT